MKTSSRIKMKITLTLLVVIAASLRVGAQGFQTLPSHNITIPDFNPPGSSTNPIYIQPVNPYPVYSPPVYNTPTIVPVPIYRSQPPHYQPQQNYPPAPMAEFETMKFIATEPYPYFLAKGDWSLTIVRGQIPRQDQVPASRTRLPKGKSRLVVGKTRYLQTNREKNWELRAMAARKEVDEVICADGRRWSDGVEVIAKFVVWR